MPALSEEPADMTPAFTEGSHGLLQVYHDGAWGFVCYNLHDVTCRIACTQLGFL